MRAFVQAVDEFLHARERFAPGSPVGPQLRWLVLFIVVFGAIYGAVMASFGGLSPGRYHHLLYVGLKVPLLLVVTSALCIPSFSVVNAVAGLRDDLGAALRALIATQACLTLVLASLAPVTAFCYFCTPDYGTAVLFNAAMFAIAAAGAQIVMTRYYGPLIRRSARHRTMLYFWFFLYALVGIEMGWILRPFIGDPRMPVAFFRSDAWGNAYVVVARLIVRILERLSPL
jgi:hypothetical protein